MQKTTITVSLLLSLVLCGCTSPEYDSTSNISSSQPAPNMLVEPVHTLSPNVVASYDFGEMAVMAGTQGEISGERYLFLGSYLEGEQDKDDEYLLQILSLAEPEKPVETGHLYLESSEESIYMISSVILSDTVLIVSTLRGLWLVDVSMPEEPTMLSQTNFNAPIWPVVIGDIVYCNIGAEYISAIDISDPAQPMDLGRVYEGDCGGIYKSYDSLLYSLSEKGLHIYDSASRPLQELGFYADPTGVEEGSTAGMTTEQREILEKDRFMWVAAANDYVYLACGLSGLRAIDVTNPSQPREVAHLDIDGTLYWLDIFGSYAYVFNARQNLKIDEDAVEILIVDISNPETPRVADSILLPESWKVFPIATGNYIYYFMNTYQGRENPSAYSMQIIDIYSGKQP